MSRDEVLQEERKVTKFYKEVKEGEMNLLVVFQRDGSLCS